jgi:hypothetical protein
MSLKECIGNTPKKQKVNISLLRQLWQRYKTGKYIIPESELCERIKIVNNLLE